MVTHAPKPRILIFSQRNISSKVLFRRPHYEFEDIISQIDSAEILAPQADLSSLRHTIAKQLAFHAPITLNPGIPEIRIKQHYDLFLAVCGFPGDLLMVNAVSNWKGSCDLSICLIDELWVKQISHYRHFLRILEKFDVVMLYYSQSIDALSRQIECKCAFMPPGIDAVLFCPYPELPARVVDVYSIGRKSEVTHRQLMKMASNGGLFYLHDSIAGDRAMDLVEHRALVANIAKRSRYFIVNPGLIDRPDIRGGQIEAGNRYYEGCAAGAIMVGEQPNNREFEKLFDWPDAVIHLPYNSGNIDTVIHELDEQPERQDRIRRTNVAQALMRHDWAYRWEAILKIAGLEPMPQLLQRKEHLGRLAEGVLSSETTRRTAATKTKQAGDEGVALAERVRRA
jgi:hypothetical protein